MAQQIAVIGLGRFGFNAARELQEAGNDVLAIDIEASNVQRIKDMVSRAVCLDAREKDRLLALGIKDFDVVVVSLGERVDTSTLVALHLKELRIPKIITKAGSTDHGKLLSLIGVHEIIFPEQEAAERLARRLATANLIDFIPLGDRHSIQEIAPPEDWIGKTLADLHLPNRYGIQVIGVRDVIRDQVSLNPGADFLIKDSDALVILGENDKLEKMKRR